MDALDGGEVLIEELLTHNRRERALTLACWSGYDSERKLARRCCKHPGPWRHLNGSGDANSIVLLADPLRQEAGLFCVCRA